MSGRGHFAKVIAMWDKMSQPVPGHVAGADAPRVGETGGSILIIDDDPHFLRILQRILSEAGYQPTTCPNSREALGLVRSGKFNLIICDLRMPECDGLDVLRAIREGGNAVPVIILTAYGEVESYLDAMNAGAAEYLNKPVMSEDLIDAVRRCMSRVNCEQNRRESQSAKIPS